jgi:HD-like signal output (HDOD) protein
MTSDEAMQPIKLEQFEQVLAEHIKSNLIDVPMLPRVANKALLLAQNSDSDASEMANLIQSDQSLAGHVMRIANSVAYTPMSNLVSLQQAIARLGMGIISEIALTAAIGAKLFHTPGYESYIVGVWRHALASSLWAKEVARHCRSNVEVAFLAGLLHSIGRPVVLQLILDLAKGQQFEMTSEQVHKLEQYYCQEVTEYVVTKWNMPQLVIAALKWKGEGDNSVAATLAAIVQAGSGLSSHMLQLDSASQDSLYELPALASLNIYHDEIDTLLKKSDDIRKRLEGLLS